MSDNLAPEGWTGCHKTEAEVRAVWPEAVWMPWQEPLLGQRVTNGHWVGPVVGPLPEQQAQRRRLHKDCPGCSCDGGLQWPAGFWFVQADGWWSDDWGGGYKAETCPQGCKPMRVLLYVPSLRPVE